MGLIYHYTNASALLGMFSKCSKKNPYITMWATHALYLNDPTEYEYGKDVCLRLLKSVEEENDVPQEERLSVRLLDKESGLKPFLHLVDVGNSMHPNSIGEGFPYIISLSKNVDTLPMWNTYAQRGNGVAIGFDEDKLKERNKDWSIKSCYYDVDNKEYLEVRDFILSMYRDIKDTRTGFRLDSHQTTFYIQSLYSEAAAYIKHKAYKDEREVRCNVNRASDILFRESNGLIIPYVEINIPVECIKKIIIGPTNDSERMRKSLFMLVNSKGCKHGLEIEESKIPYRG